MPTNLRVTTCLICLIGIGLFTGCRSDPASSDGKSAMTRPAAVERFEYHGMKFGSDYNLVLYAPDKATADAAAKAAEAEIDRLETVFSDYKADSEISKLSRLSTDGPMPAPVPVSDDLYEVLWAAQVLSYDTDGAFDVTVGPYVQLWRRSRRQQELPTSERLAEAAKAVGYQKLKLEPWSQDDADSASLKLADREAPVSPKAQLLAAKMRLDVGGIATGYIADRVLVILHDRGIGSAICDLSGDLAIGDPPPDRAGWRIAVRSLTEPDKTSDFLEVANCGVSTSGDTYRFVEIDGVRYSHIVDTKTGLGLSRRIGATVIASDGMKADMLATAVSVLGSEKGIALLESLSVEGKIVEVVGNSVHTRASQGYGAMRSVTPE